VYQFEVTPFPLEDWKSRGLLKYNVNSGATPSSRTYNNSHLLEKDVPYKENLETNHF